MSGEATAEATIAPEKRWHRIEGADLPGEGRGSSVAVDGRTGAASQWAGRFGGLANRRPDRADLLVNPDWPEFARLRGASGPSARSSTCPTIPSPALFSTPGSALLHVDQDGELV